MLNDPKPDDIENWVCVLEGGKDYEVEMAKEYLSNLEIPSNILSKRDSSFNLTVGDMALVYLYVPAEYEDEARQALDDLPDKNTEEQE